MIKMSVRDRLLLVILFVFFSITFCFSQPYIPGQVYYGRNHYVEYHAGELPIIFSAPHGGSLTPAEIPDRTYGTTVTDSYTKETALEILNAIYSKTGKYPHVIISNLKRIKLDPNRDIGEAAQGNQWAEQAWNEYHGFIDTAKHSVTRQFGKGFYVDIHGHGHDIKRLELGYLLTSSNLMVTDNQLNSAYYVNKSSIRALANETSVSFSQLVRGPKSLGTLFEGNDIAAVPSLNQPNPGSGNPFFSGGYSTRRHGSRDGGTINGVQIEAPKEGIRDTAQNRKRYARIIAEVFDEYFKEHFGWDGLVTGIEPPASEMPEEFGLYQNYPNPFSQWTLIRFLIPVRSLITLKLYNLQGQEIMTLLEADKTPGLHAIELNCSGLAAGIYFYMLKTEYLRLTKKLIIVERD